MTQLSLDQSSSIYYKLALVICIFTVSFLNKHKSKILPFETNKNKRTKTEYSVLYGLFKSLRKHAYSNTIRIIPPQYETFRMKNSDIFLISAQNIDWGGSNEYPQSIFLSRNKKNNVYPCKPQFYYIKVGFKGVKII